MKLYFYILDSDRKTGKWNLRLEECEVIEKPKTYKAATQFPKKNLHRICEKRRYWKNF